MAPLHFTTNLQVENQLHFPPSTVRGDARSIGETLSESHTIVVDSSTPPDCKETRILPPKKGYNLTNRAAIGQNSAGLSVHKDPQRRRSSERSSDSESEEFFPSKAEKRRRLKKNSTPPRRRAKSQNTLPGEDNPSSGSSGSRKKSTMEEGVKADKLAPTRRERSKRTAKLSANIKMVNSEVSAEMLQTPELRRIGNVVADHLNSPQVQYRLVLKEKLEPPKNGHLLAEKVAKGNKVLRYDAEKRQMHETTTLADTITMRDFCLATDEEIAAAKIYVKKLAEIVRAEEAPKKEKIWDRV